MGITIYYPSHILDVLLAPPLRLVWEPFSKKRSHFWHWRPFDRPVPESFRERVDPDRTARPVRGLWSALWNLNFGWQRVAILRPAHRVERYHVGFLAHNVNGRARKEVCACVVEGDCAVLVGPYPVEFFAVEHPSEELVPVSLVRVTVKGMLEERIPLL